MGKDGACMGNKNPKLQDLGECSCPGLTSVHSVVLSRPLTSRLTYVPFSGLLAPSS